MHANAGVKHFQPVSDSQWQQHITFASQNIVRIWLGSSTEDEHVRQRRAKEFAYELQCTFPLTASASDSVLLMLNPMATHACQLEGSVAPQSATVLYPMAVPKSPVAVVFDPMLQHHALGSPRGP